MKKRQALKISINLIILVSCASMMILLINEEGIVKGNVAQSNFKELIPRDIKIDAWKSIYISGQWAGYAHTPLGPYSENDRKGYPSQKFVPIEIIDSLRFL